MDERVVTLDELTNDQVEIVKVPMDEKGGVLFIGSISADEYVEWLDRNQAADKEGKKDAAALLIIKSVVKGEKDSTRTWGAGDVPKVRKLKISKSEKLLKAIFKLNGVRQPEETATKNG